MGSLLAGDEAGRFVGPDRRYSWATERAALTTVAFPLLVLVNAALGVAGLRRGRRFEPALCATVVATAALAYLSVGVARGAPSHHVVAFVAGIGLVALAGPGADGHAVGRRSPRGGGGGVPVGGRRPNRGPPPLPAGGGRRRRGDRRRPRVDEPPGRAPGAGLAPQPCVRRRHRRGGGGRGGHDRRRRPGAEAPLLRIVTALAKDGHDVRVPPARQLSFTREQYAPTRWDTSVWVGLAGRRPRGGGWRAVDTARDPAGREVTIYSRPGPP